MLTLRSIPARNLVHHWRGNVPVLLGVAVGAAVLAGALFVGDSLRGSLRDRAVRQLDGVESAWIGSRLIHQDVAGRLPGDTVPSLMLQGSVTAEAGGAGRLTRVAVVGLDDRGVGRFGIQTPPGWSEHRAVAVLSDRTARQVGVKVGDRIELSVQQFSAVPRSSLLGRRSTDDVTASVRVTVAGILAPDAAANDFSLSPNPAPPANVFVPLAYLQQRLQQPGKVNALFAFAGEAPAMNKALASALTPDDAGLRIALPKSRKGYVSVESEQLVLDPAGVAAAEAAAKELGCRSERTIVYLANWIASGSKRIPYSVVCGLNPKAAPPLGPFTSGEVNDIGADDIVLTDWPESPLKDVPVGATISVTYFEPEVEAGPKEATVNFRLAGRIPIAGPAADPDLTPPFPGITDKISIGDWNPPFPFDKSRIKPRDENERYWDKYRATPKAYISLGTAERLFRSRFGVYTSIRVAPAPGTTPEETAERLRAAVRTKLDPAALGVVFEPTRERLLAASGGSNDFAGLFLAFSFFLIVASLLLVGLLFRLNVERRAKEIGLLLTAGYSPGQVRRLLLAEAGLVAVVGSVVGVAAAVGYSRLLLAMLARLWPDESVRTFLAPHTSPMSFAIGFVGTLLMAALAVVLSLRGLTRISPPALLRGVTEVQEPEPVAGRSRLWAVG